MRNVSPARSAVERRLRERSRDDDRPPRLHGAGRGARRAGGGTAPAPGLITASCRPLGSCSPAARRATAGPDRPFERKGSCWRRIHRTRVSAHASAERNVRGSRRPSAATDLTGADRRHGARRVFRVAPRSPGCADGQKRRSRGCVFAAAKGVRGCRVRIECEHRFDVPLEEGFAYITEPANWLNYWPGIVRIAPGSRWGAPGRRGTHRDQAARP